MPPRKSKITATKTKAISTAHALKFFLSSVQDPNHPTHCGICLNGAFVECTTVDDRALAIVTDHLPKVNPELWDAAIGFLLAKRTHKEAENLLVRLSDCRCQMDGEQGRIQRYHQIGKHAVITSETFAVEVDGPQERDDAPKITETGFSLILNILSTLSMVLQNSHSTSAAKGASSSWPVNSMDLLPFGADNFVESMLQWYRFFEDTVVFRLTAHVLRFCQMLVIPSLIKYKFIETVVNSARRMVDITMAVEKSPTKPLFFPLRIFVRRFYLHAQDLRVCFQAYLFDVPYDCRGPLFRGSETKAMQLCSMVLYLDNLLDSQDPDRPSFDATLFAGYGQDLFRFFHMHMYPRPSMPVHPLIYQLDQMTFPPPPSCRAPRETALYVIQQFRTEARCSAQGCSNVFQSVGRSFQRCARCGVVAYCGRECQTKAWKEEKYPHKRVCPAFRTLIEKGGGQALFFDHLRVGDTSQGGLGLPIQFSILRNWQKESLSEEDLTLIEHWSKAIEESRGTPMPDGSEWNPGFSDYNAVIASLCANEKCKTRVYKYLNRLARWPSEVAKEERLLKLQPFWEEDIDGFWTSE